MNDASDSIVYEHSQMSEEMKVFAAQILHLAKKGYGQFSVTADNDVVVTVNLKVTTVEES